ncbi:hypothetical protein RB601_000582 [Gaeumannomyces tritici]
MNRPSLLSGAARRAAAEMSPSALLKRSEPAALSPGAIAGVVIGSILGASIIALCVWPFIARARRRARGEGDPFNPEAEMEAAQASGNASSSSPGPTAAGSKRLSVDDFGPAATRQTSRQHQPSLSKEFGTPGSDFSPPGARVPGGYGFQNQMMAPAAAAAAAAGPNGQFHQGAFVQQPGLMHQSTMGTVGTMDTMGTGVTVVPGTTPPDTPLQGSAHHRRQSSSKSSIVKAFQSATSVFRRTSTRSMPGHHSPQPPQPPQDATFMPPQQMPYYISPIDNMPPATGAAASYYSGAPMSPATSAWSTPPPMNNNMYIPSAPHPGGQPHASVEYHAPGIGPQDMGQQFQQFAMFPQQQQLVPPSQGISPMSPASQTTSPLIKDEMMSEDEDGTAPFASAQAAMPGRSLGASPSSGHSRTPSQGLTFPRSEKARVGMSPSSAGPGTVNPLDIMAPTNDSERYWQVQNELVKPEQTSPPPPPQSYENFAGQQEQPPQQQQQRQQQLPPVVLESADGFTLAPNAQGGNAADEIDTALFDSFCDLDANAKEEWTLAAYQDEQQKQKRREQLAQQQQLQQELAQQQLLQQQLLQAQQLQQFQQQAQQLLQTQGQAQQPAYYGHGQMQFGFQQGNSQLGNLPPGYPPQTPMFIKADPDPNYVAQSFTPFNISDNSTPHQPASYSSGPSNMNTPNTQLTEPASSYAPSTPSNGGLSPPQGSDASPQKTYPCPKCDKVFTQQHKLNHHDRYHTRKYVCTYEGCDGSFGTTTHLRRHINDRHKKERKFHCTVEGCQWSRSGGLSFPRKDNWKRHMVKKHPGQPHDEPIEASVP